MKLLTFLILSLAVTPHLSAATVNLELGSSVIVEPAEEPVEIVCERKTTNSCGIVRGYSSGFAVIRSGYRVTEYFSTSEEAMNRLSHMIKENICPGQN